jgi:hypothetical protein
VLAPSLYDDPAAGLCGDAPAGLDEHAELGLSADEAAGAHVHAVIWSPNLGVFAVSAGGVLYAFAAWRTRYLDSVSAVRLARTPFSLLFLELSSYYLNVVQRHVYAADVLVRCGVDRDDSR